MRSTSKIVALSTLLACATGPALFGATASDASTKSDTAVAPVVRGYTLSGEIVLYPAGEQQLPAGWALVPEGSLAQGATVVRLQGGSEVVTAGTDIVSIVSQSMPTGEGQLVLARPGQAALGLGDLALVCSKDAWTIVSRSTQWNGRPVFELPLGAQSVNWLRDGQFALTGELLLSPTVGQESGLALEHTPVIGAVTLLASPYFEPAEPVVSNAPPVAASGPDVIVSTVGSTINKDGTVGSITAYSVTTVSCNIGGADAIWLSGVNQHPVIGAQLYRLKTVSGSQRFEQVGMSWLKHGFCAADAPSCGNPYTPNGSCSWLGEFATDTYDASLNGQQTNLGPRSEIQAWTGAYPYPYVLGAGATGNAIYKRLQVHNADLDPSLNAGAKYWGEVVYITTDEALDATRFNNYSHRLVNLGAQTNTPPGSNLGFASSTVAQVPAIQGWANNETGVTLVNVDVPGDGRFILGYKVTALGIGQYHYEYALFNMNSDRSGQAFEVPLQGANTVSNVGFHDVDYHSGEPYSLTDWTATTTLGSNVNWATQTYAANVNANALRWSTTYNFRFDSSGSPMPGQVTLTLFKPGNPTTISIPADVPGSNCAMSTYCTPSITTHGCTSSISGSGTPSASATSGFTMTVANAEGQRTGLFFYGQGATALPWGVGSLSYKCVTSPTQRTTVLASGGTAGSCSGNFSLDWNAWASANPGALGAPFASGQIFYAQCWFRDPAAVNATNLSDGLVFTLCP
jgi:hypothetical protein